MKVGIVGCGSIGSRHRDNLHKLGHQTLVYDPAVQKDVRFERLIYDSDVDAVVISTPSQFHEGPLRAAIERGKHVLIEKPISTGIGALPELLQAADAKKLVVMMGNNLRFHPCVLQTKRWINDDHFGRPIWASFICATEYTETAARDGVVLNTGAHEVDVALHLFGPARVACSDHAADKLADFVLIHESGVRSTFHIDICTTYRTRQFWIGFEGKTLGADLDRRRFADDDRFSAYEYRGSYDDDYLDEMRVFLAKVMQDGRQDLPGATGHDGLATLRVLREILLKANRS